MPCCNNRCLRQIPISDAVAAATACTQELHGMGAAEKKIYLLEKIRNCASHTHESGYISFNWVVGVAPNVEVRNVCRKCFRNAYSCSSGYIDNIVRDMKDNVRSYDRGASDTTASKSGKVFTVHLEQFAANYGVNLTSEQKQAITAPHTVASLTCFS